MVYLVCYSKPNPFFLSNNMLSVNFTRQGFTGWGLLQHQTSSFFLPYQTWPPHSSSSRCPQLASSAERDRSDTTN